MGNKNTISQEQKKIIRMLTRRHPEATIPARINDCNGLFSKERMKLDRKVTAVISEAIAVGITIVFFAIILAQIFIDFFNYVAFNYVTF